MKILVTGGAGFIGSFLCEKLLNDGHEVIAVDNLFTGTKENIKHLFDHYKFELIRHDIVEPLLLEVERIYNFACPASPVHYQFNPIKTVKTNVMGTLNMLGMAKRVHARILQASTSEVYGDPDVHPQKEDYWGRVNCLGPRSCYDEGKRIAETLMINYQLKENVDTRIIRIFNTYGPNMATNDGRVVSNFIVQALQNQPITIYGEGNQTRSFCYVTDLIDGAVKMMENNDSFRGPVNLGNPVEITILQLAMQIIRMTGSKSQLIFKALPEDDPIRRKPDITLAKQKLNWQPTTDLETGLTKTIEYFEKVLTKGS